MQLTTLEDILEWATQLFEDSNIYFGHGTDNAWDEAVHLAMHVLKLPSDVDAAVIDTVPNPDQKAMLIQLINRRASERMPVPYLTQEAWFANLKFYVDQRVIIPRSPMAELILNGFQPWLGERSVLRILDLCTGSGCIAIACAKMFQNAKVDAVDISAEALAVAKINVQAHECEDRVRLITSDLFSACKNEKYDIIISNPPYVSQQEIEDMPVEYSAEPALALAAGNDGLDIVKTILKEACHYMTENGLLFVEVGNAEVELQNQYSHLPFTWLEFEQGGTGVFLLRAGDKAWLPVF